MMQPDVKAQVITAALGGYHLDGLLPMQDNNAAVRRLVTHCAGGGGSDLGDWQVKRTGIDTEHGLIPWADVLDVIRRGCWDGRREAYETAQQKWLDANKANPQRLPRSSLTLTDQEYRQYQTELHVSLTALREAQAAIVNAGCAPDQERLF